MKRGRTPFGFLALSLSLEPVRKDRNMPRRRRIAPAGFVYHVMNRAAGRLVLFETRSDYIAFEHVLSLGQLRSERLSIAALHMEKRIGASALPVLWDSDPTAVRKGAVPFFRRRAPPKRGTAPFSGVAVFSRRSGRRAHLRRRRQYVPREAPRLALRCL